MVRRITATLLAACTLAAAWSGLAVTSVSAIEVSATYRRNAEAAFGKYLAGLWPAAKARGISRKTFDRAVKSVRIEWDIPDLAPPAIAGEQPKASRKRQAEFGSPGRYFSERNLSNLAAIGRRKIAENADTFERIEKASGVPRQVVAAIWGRETGYSGVDIPHDALSVLATHAFFGRRPEFFEPELLAAMEIVDRGIVPISALKSSWAGAMGHTQMLPGLYLKHATDGDGDGKSDIWNSIPDALATTAAYLRSQGWVPGLSWGYEVSPSDRLDCTLEGPDGKRTIGDWVKQGASRVAGRQWPGAILKARGYLIMPAGRYGPAFIASDNYYAIKAYNELDLYVLFVGNLADRMAGAGSFATAWRDVDTYTRDEMKLVQEKLVRLGYNVGDSIDGLIGFRTRTATGMHQRKLGIAVDCWPNRAFIARLK